jgi:hypothetical protein
VLAREGDPCLGPLVGQCTFPAELVQHGNRNPDAGHEEEGRDLLGQGPRGLALLDRLVRIAQIPQDSGGKEATSDPRLPAGEEHRGVVALNVVQGQALLQVRPGCAEFTQME